MYLNIDLMSLSVQHIKGSSWSPLGFDASIAQLKALTEFTGRREMFIIFHQGNLRYEISASVPDVS